jgi:hypothetical protein
MPFNPVLSLNERNPERSGPAVERRTVLVPENAAVPEASTPILLETLTFALNELATELGVVDRVFETEEVANTVSSG